MSLLIALPLRLPGMREWWLNPDEGTYYSIATRTDDGDFWREVIDNAHPPLYYLLLRPLGLVTDDFFWLRTVAVACGVLAVYTTWGAARELAGRGRRGALAGLGAGALVALSPAAVELSKVIRPYMLQLVLLSGSLWLLLRHLRTRSRRALGGYVVLICLALLTHYSSALAFGAFVLTVLAWGLAQRWGVGEWRSAGLAQAVPGLLLSCLYLFHLRRLMDSALADAALNGWLRYYMIRSPEDAWLAFMGFLRLLGDPWLVGPLAVLFLASLALSAGGDDRRPLILGTSGLAVAVAGSWAGLYPLGPTRHAVWVVPFVVPVLGWLAAEVASFPRRQMLLALSAVGVVLLTGDDLGRRIGGPRAPGAAPERVLRSADVAIMRDVLDPQEGPSLVVMGRQTFYLLLPLYARERDRANFAADSSVFHFRIGDRDVVAASGWDLRALPGVDGDASYLLDALQTADSAFGEVDLQRDSVALLLAGGWALPVVSELSAMSSTDPLILGAREVPGLVALLLDVGAYRRASAR